MSIKSLKKQLFLSALFLLILILSLSGATFAWFSLNSTVTATGMQISANTEGVNFEITTSVTNAYIDIDTGKFIVNPDGSYITDESSIDTAEHPHFSYVDAPIFTEGQTTANARFGEATLFPTFPVVKSTYPATPAYTVPASPADWYHSYSNNYDDADIKPLAELDNLTSKLDVVDGILKNVIAGDGGEGNQYSLVGTYYVRLNPEKTGNVKIKNIRISSVTVSEASGENPVNADFLQCVKILAVGSKAAKIYPAGDVAVNDQVSLIDELNPIAGECGRVDIYAFFDGQDAACRSSIYDADKIAISVAVVGDVEDIIS